MRKLTVGLALYAPLCNCSSRFIVLSIPFKTNPAVLSFHITPFLHLHIDSYNASKPITFSMSKGVSMSIAELAPFKVIRIMELLFCLTARDSVPCVRLSVFLCYAEAL